MYTYIGTYTYIYIYTHSPSLDTLCPIRLSLKPCWLFPPRGSLSLSFFHFSSKIQKQNSNRSASHVPQETCCKTTVISLAQKKAAPFFSTGALGRAFLVKLPFYPPFRDPAQEPCPLPASKLALSPRPGQEGVYPLAGWVNPPS